MPSGKGTKPNSPHPRSDSKHLKKGSHSNRSSSPHSKSSKLDYKGKSPRGIRTPADSIQGSDERTESLLRSTSSSETSETVETTTSTDLDEKKKRTVRSIAVFFLVVGLILGMTVLALLRQKAPPPEVPRQRRSVSRTVMGVYYEWAAVSGAKECQGVPRKIFKRNGTIGDVAVATLLCICVVMPHRCGLGGGFYAVYYNRAKKQAYSINCGEKAAKAARSDMFQLVEKEKSLFGGLAVAVFGELRGYELLLKTTGSTVPWRELFQDAITFAEKGFTVYDDLEEHIRRLQIRYYMNAEIRDILFNSTVGRTLTVGDRFVNKPLANTLRYLARSKPDALSVGQLAEALANEIQKAGGIITADDFRSFYPISEKALETKFGDTASLYTTTLPSGGPILSYIVGIMDKFRSNAGYLRDNEFTWHRMIEASKFGFARRSNFSDPYSPDVTTNQRKALLDLAQSLTHDTVRRLTSNKIRNKPQPKPSFYSISGKHIRDHGSGQLAVVAPNGDALAVISSINTEFGALVLSHQTGIWMNNAMDHFSTPKEWNEHGLPPTAANAIAPGKRPLSSSAPSIMVNGRGDVILVITSTGSGTIITGIAQVLMRIRWMEHSVKQAIDCGRLHSQLYPSTVFHERIADNVRLRGRVGRTTTPRPHTLRNRLGRHRERDCT
ncbi:scoloptoxin SSD14-like isoform X2 [Ornithodoros turicata]|uniref:scoloptoxin SSD14-like isoform X2 n=1 Tax=Ornithodoros turicata TaxID=34597 RepID=UPI003138B401